MGVEGVFIPYTRSSHTVFLHRFVLCNIYGPPCCVFVMFQPSFVPRCDFFLVSVPELPKVKPCKDNFYYVTWPSSDAWRMMSVLTEWCAEQSDGVPLDLSGFHRLNFVQLLISNLFFSAEHRVWLFWIKNPKDNSASCDTLISFDSTYITRLNSSERWAKLQ